MKTIHWVLIGVGSVVLIGAGVVLYYNSENKKVKNSLDTSFLIASDRKAIGEYVDKMIAEDLKVFKDSYIGNKNVDIQMAMLKKYGYKG